MKQMRLIALLSVLLLCGFSKSKPKIKFGIVDRMAYPFILEEGKGAKSQGLLFDLSTAIAEPLNAEPDYTFLPRKRVESLLKSGKVDLVCYLSSQWVDDPLSFEFSKENIKQVERVISKKGTEIPENFATNTSLQNKKIALMLGYHYPLLNSAIEAKRLIRIDKSKVSELFEMVNLKKADYMVTSEPEIEGYFKQHPEKRKDFNIEATPFDTVRTQCAISKMSHWNAHQINKAIEVAEKSGQLENISKKYNLTY